MENYQLKEAEVYNRWTVETSIDVMRGIMCLDWYLYILNMFFVKEHLN